MLGTFDKIFRYIFIYSKFTKLPCTLTRSVIHYQNIYKSISVPYLNLATGDASSTSKSDHVVVTRDGLYPPLLPTQHYITHNMCYNITDLLAML